MRSRLLRSCTRFQDDVGRQFNLLLEGIGFITFPESPALSRLEPCGRSFEVLYGLFRPRCQDGFFISRRASSAHSIVVFLDSPAALPSTG